MADGPLMYGVGGTPGAILDYQGRENDRTWITREKVLEDRVLELVAERDFLREMLRAATSNQDSSRHSSSETSS